MNRLIIIGNGFDLAHLYKTSYKDFIEDYWSSIIENLQKEKMFFSKELIIEKIYTAIDWNINEISKYKFLTNSLNKSKCEIIFKNKFLEHISSRQDLNNWVDIENEYYNQLLEIVKNNNFEEITKVNNDFQSIIDLFTVFLRKSVDNSILQHINDEGKNEYFDRMSEVLFSKIGGKDITGCRRLDKNIDDILIVNFNYTYTDKFYVENPKYSSLYDKIDVIRIHGELDESKNNRIIFGFGDELDKNYNQIENLNDNRYFDFIKSFKYLENDNYSKILNFIESDNFHVNILGHSCGISDRTLLNTIFEHRKCISIEPHYYKGKNSDNYADIVKNISRCFNNKIEMRAKVLNKNYCEPICNW